MGKLQSISCNLMIKEAFILQNEVFLGILERIKQRLQESGYSQKSFSEAICISQNQVSNYLNGKRTLPLDIFCKLQIN
jgi:predicted transcriptional regulator